MTRVQYTGHQEMTYLGYAEVGVGVLTCQPGGVYDITPVAFNAAEVPTDGRFVVLDDEEAENVPDPDLIDPEPVEE